jgi:PAS domain S-box-containing protein
MKRALESLFDRHPNLPAHAATLFWTATMLGLWWNGILNAQIEKREFALAEARAASRSDLAHNRWIAKLGGVYAPASDPALRLDRLAHLPDRDGTTTTGQPLTLVNPGCMIRSVHEFAVQGSGVHAHLIGLHPRNPENQPSEWDRRALQALAGGQKEFFEIVTDQGTNTFRYMAGLPTENSCLKCHADQDFGPGQLRGGLRIDVPMLSAGFAASDAEERSSNLGFSLIWLLGLAGIQGTSMLARKGRIERERAHAEITHFFQIIPDLVCIATTRGRILRLNPEWERVLGVPLPELLSKGLLERVHPDDRLETLRQFRRVARGRPVESYVHRCRTADGDHRWIEWNASALGAEQLVFGAARDVTTRRRTELLARTQRDLGLAVSAIRDADEIFRRCLAAVIEASGMDAGGIYLKENGTGDFILGAHTGLTDSFVDEARRCAAGSPKALLIERGLPV